MPTDKALAVMTPKHLAMLDSVALEHEKWYPTTSKLLREIESVVRYLVDHPERLAGEDEVVVKREEIKTLTAYLAGITDHRYATESLRQSWMYAVKGWLAGSPTAQESTSGKQK